MEKFIIVLVVVLAVIAIAQLLRVYEQVSLLKGKKEEDISEKDNHLNANLMLVFMVAFYAFFIWLTVEYGGNNFGKGPAASDIARHSRWLLNINWAILISVFFLTNTLLFVFAWKYYYREDRKATWFPHDNKLELIWTVVPTIVLAVIIVLGLKTWFNVMDKHEATDDMAFSEQPINVEIMAEQFNFKVRYAGADNKLGQSDYKLITANNAVGVVTTSLIDSSLNGIDGFDMKIEDLEGQLKRQRAYLPDWKVEELESKIIRFNRLKRRLMALSEDIKTDTSENWDMVAGNDIMDDELFLIKNKRYNFVYRSKDVIHSAYFPHFESQMNMVPGQTTYQGFTPVITTEEMRDTMDNQDFDFVLVCNKICGGGHSGMKAKITVGTRVDFINYILDKPLKTISGAEFKDSLSVSDRRVQDSLSTIGKPRTMYDIRDLEVGSGYNNVEWPYLDFKQGQIDTIMMVRNKTLPSRYLENILSEEPQLKED